MTSPDLTEANIDKLAELFPTVVTETLDADGNPQRAIDFDLLRQELSDHIVEGPQERYRLDWPGKRAAAFAANAPIAKTLRPVREESVDFDTTKNLFIEGDNLDALKLLQESYLGKVKIIYVDPPYNTNNDFIYRDRFATDTEEYLEASRQSDSAGNRLVSNVDGSGRYHSDWLSMIYPRLKLARNLLAPDGVILVSINEVEVANLRSIGAELFGSQNFVTQFVWINSGNVDQSSKVKGLHEYIVAFARNEEFLPKPEIIDPNVDESSKLYKDRIENSIVKNGAKNPPSTVTLPVGFPAAFEEGFLAAGSKSSIQIIDDIRVSDGELFEPARVKSGWSSRTLLELFIANDCNPVEDSEGRETWFELSKTGAINGIKKRSARQGHVTSLLRNLGTTEVASNALKRIGIDFSYPKPVNLVKFLFSAFTPYAGSGIILDLFAGSGTSAEAVLNLNAEDGGNRTFILIQLNEEIQTRSAFSTISELCRHRIVESSRALTSVSHGLDFGFRTLSVDTTNMTNVLREPDETDQLALQGLESSIKSDRTAEDLLFQVLLDWGLELTVPIETEKLCGHEVFDVDEGALIACFGRSLDSDVVHSIAARNPIRAVFRDDGFGSDSQRINVEQIFREVSPSTEVKAI